MSDEARKIAETLRQHGYNEAADVADLAGGVDTRPAPQPGSAEPPPGIPGDPADLARAQAQAQARAETDRHFAGLSPDEAGKAFFNGLLSGGGQ